MIRQATYGQADDEHEFVELFFSCRNLIDLDTFSKTDPYLKLYERKNVKTDWRLIDKTEIVKDNLNPDFTKSFVIKYIFEIQQFYKAELWDYDGPGKDEWIGQAEFELGELVGSKNNMMILDLINDRATSKKGGKLVVREETVASNKDHIYFNADCKDLNFWK
jgi:Ca2+-dependent lipid-binding protein